MIATSLKYELASESESNPETPAAARQRLLELARHLDRLGRNTEEFLCRQLEQLEREIDEFEREKAAWRRQLHRESNQLAGQRKELERLSVSGLKGPVGDLSSKSGLKQEAADLAARRTVDAPLRLLIQPRKASSMQVSAVLFEISKLNRDLGGQGVRFEVAEVRQPKKKLLSRKNDVDATGEIFELHGFSALPLKARGNHVTLDVDITERVENWIAFKSRLLQSALANGDLAAVYHKSKVVERETETRSFLRDATRGQERVAFKESESIRYATGALMAASASDCIRQQVLRLESCCERLCQDAGLQAMIEV